MSSRQRSRTDVARAVTMMCVLAVALVACSDDKKAPTTTAPAGFTVMSDADEGFALAVPSDWTAIPLSNNPAEFDQDANRLRAENPKLASILNQARVLGQSGGIFMAVTPDGTGSVNLTADKPKEKTLEEIVRASVTALEGIGASNIRRESSTLDGKPSMKVSLRVPVQTDAGEIPTDEVQHYLLEDGKAFILTVAAAPAPVGDAIAASLRIR